MGYWHPSLSAGEELYGLALLFGYTERHNLDTRPLRLTTRLALACTVRTRPHEARDKPLIPHGHATRMSRSGPDVKPKQK
jgi:hypothetical protein